MTLKKLSDKNTKTELLSGYEELLATVTKLQADQKAALAENQKLARQVAASQHSTPAGSAVAPVSSPVAAAAATRDGNTLQALETVQQNLGATASQLSEWLTHEAEALAAIQERVTAELADLKNLYDLQPKDGLLGELIESHEAQARQFLADTETEREALQLSRRTAQEAWALEQQAQRKALRDSTEAFNREFERKSEEDQYALELTRQLDSEEYENQTREQRQALQDRRESAAKAFAETEKALAERERDAAETAGKFALLDQEKEAALKKAKDEGRGIASYTAKTRADIQAKDIEGQRQGFDLRIESLNSNIADQQVRIQSLTQQLEAASRQVQDLAVKAIEGASGANSSQVLREIALEQAKQTKKY
ncbi:hypothetical protein [Deinococcus aquatilis]|jgi:hypothetical protein|uniref:hypothetical protein n=1 Tax=Deinococcus aquatilis TaxID=519440 RepID=UPI000375F98A|nr:hypothetical protein [Deinococcus aquatilis]